MDEDDVEVTITPKSMRQEMANPPPPPAPTPAPAANNVEAEADAPESDGEVTITPKSMRRDREAAKAETPDKADAPVAKPKSDEADVAPDAADAAGADGEEEIPEPEVDYATRYTESEARVQELQGVVDGDRQWFEQNKGRFANDDDMKWIRSMKSVEQAFTEAGIQDPHAALSELEALRARDAHKTAHIKALEAAFVSGATTIQPYSETELESALERKRILRMLERQEKNRGQEIGQALSQHEAHATQQLVSMDRQRQRVAYKTDIQTKLVAEAKTNPLVRSILNSLAQEAEVSYDAGKPKSFDDLVGHLRRGKRAADAVAISKKAVAARGHVSAPHGGAPRSAPKKESRLEQIKRQGLTLADI